VFPIQRYRCSGRKGENIMRSKVLSILAASFLVLAPAVYGQEENSGQQKKGQQKQQADRPGQETVMGCLTEEQGSYKLSTSSGDEISVNGPASLTKHKDHTVKLTGTTSTEGGKKTLNVSKIEHVSASCAK